ncbi:hypothetical protein LguiA_036377 [Lonicera macranthoides]
MTRLWREGRLWRDPSPGLVVNMVDSRERNREYSVAKGESGQWKRKKQRLSPRLPSLFFNGKSMVAPSISPLKSSSPAAQLFPLIKSHFLYVEITSGAKLFSVNDAFAQCLADSSKKQLRHLNAFVTAAGVYLVDLSSMNYRGPRRVRCFFLSFPCHNEKSSLTIFCGSTVKLFKKPDAKSENIFLYDFRV